MRPVLVVIAVALSSCAAPAAKRGIVGTQAEALLRCAGAPHAVKKDGAATLWSYAHGDCSADVELRADRVSAVRYSSPDCAALLAPCGEEDQTRRCPDGWSSKNNEPCYPDKAFFNGSIFGGSRN